MGGSAMHKRIGKEAYLRSALVACARSAKGKTSIRLFFNIKGFYVE
jgi:hypothetical protein